MKRKIFLLIICAFISEISFSQNIGINSTGATPRDCAMLDILSSTTGLLIPNLALTSLITYAPATGTAVDGLIIYNTATAGVAPNNVYPGYYYWSTTSSKWIALAGNGSKNWSLTGNAGTTPSSAAFGSVVTASSNFLGTTDATDFVVATNNYEIIRVKAGAATGAQTLFNNPAAPPASPLIYAESNGTTFTSLFHGKNTSTTGVMFGLKGQTASNGGFGVWGYATNTGAIAGGGSSGVYGQSDGSNGYGVWGTDKPSGSGGASVGVLGESFSTSGGFGVKGKASGASGANYGVYGQSTGTGGIGVYGTTSASSGSAWNNSGGTTAGVYGVTSATAANYQAGVFGYVTNSGLPASGVLGAYSTSIYAGLGYNDVNARAWGMLTPGDVLIGSTTAIAASTPMAYTDAALQITTSTANKNGLYVSSTSASSATGAAITAYSNKYIGVFGNTIEFSGGFFGCLNTASGTGFAGADGLIGTCATTAATVNGVPLGYYPATGLVGIVASANSASNYALYAQNNVSTGWSIYSAGGKCGSNGPTWTASDANLKTNIKNLENALEKVLKMRAVTYEFKPEYALAGEKQIGFLSQEIKNLFPEAVCEMPLPSTGSVSADGKRNILVKRPEKALFMSYSTLIPVLAQAIKEQQDIIQKLEERLIELEKKLVK